MNFRESKVSSRLIAQLPKAKILACLLFASADFFADTGLLVSTEAFAAGAHEGPLPSLAEFIISKKIYWINFIVYTGILVFLISRAFPKAWNNRRQNYISALELGKEKLIASEMKLSEARNFHEAVPHKIAEIKTSLEKEVEIEAARLLTDAQQKAVKFLQLTQQNAEAEKRLVDQKFKKELIDLAVIKARSKAQQAAEQTDVEAKLRTKVVDRINNLVN